MSFLKSCFDPPPATRASSGDESLPPPTDARGRRWRQASKLVRNGAFGGLTAFRRFSEDLTEQTRGAPQPEAATHDGAGKASAAATAAPVSTGGGGAPETADDDMADPTVACSLHRPPSTHQMERSPWIDRRNAYPVEELGGHARGGGDVATRVVAPGQEDIFMDLMIQVAELN